MPFEIVTDQTEESLDIPNFSHEKKHLEADKLVEIVELHVILVYARQPFKLFLLLWSHLVVFYHIVEPCYEQLDHL